MGNTIKLTVDVQKDDYLDYVEQVFDYKVQNIQTNEIPNNLDFEKLHDWNLGLVCGASGTGKSTILKSLGGEKSPSFDPNKPLISNFTNMTPEEASKILMAMGLSSVPTWIRPYRLLSNGEQYRARLAKILAEAEDGETILIDEFTSVVDRNVAKSMSFALQKYVKRHNLKVILFSCHYDVIEWLNPNWIYDLNKGGVLEENEFARQIRKPEVHLQMYRTEADTWNIFKAHHYMTQEFNKAARCFVFTWNNQPVAFVGVLNEMTKGRLRVTRIVVLPEFQGLGIGGKIFDFLGGLYAERGEVLGIRTVHAGMGTHPDRSKCCKYSTTNGKKWKLDKPLSIETHRVFINRISYAFQYCGEPIEGYSDLLLPVSEMRKRKKDAQNHQMSLNFD